MSHVAPFRCFARMVLAQKWLGAFGSINIGYLYRLVFIEYAYSRIFSLGILGWNRAVCV